MTAPTIRAALDTFQEAANRGTAVHLSPELVQELRDALKAEPEGEGLSLDRGCEAGESRRGGRIMTYPLTTTLNRIYSRQPCVAGWKRGLTALGKTQADDEPLTFLELMDKIEPWALAQNRFSVNAVFWCAKSAPEYDVHWRQFAVWCVRQVQDQLTDPRSLQALDIAQRYAERTASLAELIAALVAAEDAVEAVVNAAGKQSSTNLSRQQRVEIEATEAVLATTRPAAWRGVGEAFRAVVRVKSVQVAVWGTPEWSSAYNATEGVLLRGFCQLVTDGTLPDLPGT